MAKGLCSNSKCLVQLTADNSAPSYFKNGYGYCRSCTHVYSAKLYQRDSEKIRAASAKYRKNNPDLIRASNKYQYLKNRDKDRKRRFIYNRTSEGRMVCLRAAFKRDSTPIDDLLRNMNFYKELIRDNECHYCLGSLNSSGHALDRIVNELGHRAFNVVPCCRACNLTKGSLWEYEHMMLLAPKLREIRRRREATDVVAPMREMPSTS